MTFVSRVEKLAKALGGMSEVASKMGISRQTLYQALNREPSLKTLKKLTDVELSVLSENRDTLGEPEQTPYGRAAVSRSQLEAQFRAFLDAAERVPGGLGYAAVQLGLHFQPADLRRLDPSYDPVGELRRLAGVRADPVHQRKAG